MPIQSNLIDLIKILRTGTPDELGKAWRERYKNIYSKPNPEVAETDMWIRSNKGMPDLDDKERILDFFDGKL